ncbi:MAG: Asp-tRNA(Asn)/Glu-tRNA(Gln) amidotransferase subunit GatC [Thermodesulfovibrionia bacterium]|nr:Asp-tRNA(Asn)/Glu-tRNA(Gln) amidotransferase subunit GatC [Thermodesulfovibrionia bacterium]MCK5427051.1 Asp-tRNA(Asn)/Glu-tRNA(Gln) amidotransferase subunit GatC [Thermodesulfovibrionia bacterium]MCK5512270.1 Asp-tRNA(Asn)/Glu-tRNA(Gln) amidotransferase subunit GatC [Thermodesulfovibrionia bacterium]
MKIDHIARLARLELSDNEKEFFAQQMTNIMEYFDKLNELDTRDVEPTSHVLSMKNIFRDDEQTPSLSREKALRNAPGRIDNFYRVPKIIE